MLIATVFAMPVLVRHVAQRDFADIEQRHGGTALGRLFRLGLATGLVYFLPLFNLIAPVFAALAFVHLCLDELQRSREGGKQDSGKKTQEPGTAPEARLLT